MNHEKQKFPSYCCQRCGETIGWLQRAMEAVFGDIHGCSPPRTIRETAAMRSQRINEAGRKAMQPRG